MTLISVIIPVYQGAKTISQAIDSVLNQSFKDYEIIVVDDGSTDNLNGVLNKYGEKIKLIKQMKSGVSASRNNGIKNSSGELIAFLDADDIWLPNKLAQQVKMFDANPHLGVVFGNVYFWDGKIYQDKTYFDLMQPYRGEIITPFFAVDFVPFLSVLMRKKILNKTDLFDETIRYVEDYELLLRIALNWEFDYVDFPVGAYRISNQQVSKDYLQVADYLLKMKESFYLKNINVLGNANKKIINRGLHNKYIKLAMLYMKEGKTFEAKIVLKRYLSIRGISVVWIMFYVLNLMPNLFKIRIIQIWEKYHKKPEYGIY
jgi:glycosyltransferase involved in cell wall biosynthesis